MPAPKKTKKKAPPKKSVGGKALESGQKKLLIGVAVLGGALLYRHFHTGTATAVTSGNSTTSGSIAPYTPQSPIVVPAGESIYDPNSQGLLTAPGSGPSNASTAAPSTGANPVTTLMAPVSVRRTHTKPAKRKVTTKGRVHRPTKPVTPKMTGQATTLKRTTRKKSVKRG